jgi:hypothetical protein
MMARADLMAIALEDLVSFTNRGTVNRAQREAEDLAFTCEWEELPDDTVIARWTDGVECVLPGRQTVREGRCSCPAGRMCRHLMRTILRYKKAQSTAVVSTAALGEWCPGDISDEVLGQMVPKVLLEKARRQFEEGLLVELVRGPKPTAYIHGLSVNIRFLVPGDPRYTHIDCGIQFGPQMTALAVWAFRALPKHKRAGLVSSASVAIPPPEAVLEEIENCLSELLEHGFSGVSEHFSATLARAAASCLKADLIWPGEIISGSR